MKLKTRTMDLCGSSYEIGKQLGSTVNQIPALKEQYTAGFSGFGQAELEKAERLFVKWCPGLNEEIHGFADALQVPYTQIFYYGMTYLRPNCSHIALHSTATECGRPLIARNYEFNHEAEDFTLVKTRVSGKYTHMGTSVLLIGRDDGFNECGLAVTMSSCGFPVGAMKFMRKPKMIGLQYWAVIRSVLENCKDVKEALEFLADMPIAYNLNLLLADKSGEIALVETLDGRQAIKRIHKQDKEPYLSATNHPVLPELIPFEPTAMKHSLQRYDWISRNLSGNNQVTKQDLKRMLLSEYPDGLCCHYFKEFFGTTKSMVIDPAEGTIEICWGGQIENGWKEYQIQDPLKNTEKEIEIKFDLFHPGMGEFVPLSLPANK